MSIASFGGTRLDSDGKGERDQVCDRLVDVTQFTPGLAAA
jgi:hypothetical protein